LGDGLILSFFRDDELVLSELLFRAIWQLKWQEPDTLARSIRLFTMANSHFDSGIYREAWKAMFSG
jgi:hypothetical protein